MRIHTRCEHFRFRNNKLPPFCPLTAQLDGEVRAELKSRRDCQEDATYPAVLASLYILVVTFAVKSRTTLSRYIASAILSNR